MTTSKLPIPDGVLKQHTIILGKTGAGKSSVARLLVEHLLGSMRGSGFDPLVPPVTIIDPKGDWWGIKSSANGREGGLPVAIFGGEHAEVPITPNSGAAVAKIATEARIPILVDLGGWLVSEKTRFFLDFAPVYYRAAGARYLMVDEAHQFCPKGKIPDPQVGKMLHWMNTIAGEGRGKGITLIAASQRPQKVHNDFLTQCETLIAMRVIHPADMRAYRDWIDGCGDPRLGSEIMSSVAALPKGSAWVWSPEIGFGPARVAFPKYWTYDSFKPQERLTTLEGWHEVDLGTLKAQFAVEIRQAEQNDPKVLHKRIRELEAKLIAGAEASASASPDALKVAYQTGLERGIELTMASGHKAIGADRAKAHDVLSPLIGILDGVRSRLVDHTENLMRDHALILRPSEAGPPPRVPTQTPGNQLLTKPKRDALFADVARKANRDIASGGVTGLQRKVLNALAWLEAKGIDRPSRATVGAVAGVKPTGGYFENTLGSMRTSGLIEYPGPGAVNATAKGRDLADPVDCNGEVYEQWLGILTGLEREIVATLVKVHPRELTRAELGDALGKEPSGGYFENTLGRLRTMGAIEYPRPGSVALTRYVMP